MTLFVIKNLEYDGYIPKEKFLMSKDIKKAKTFKLEFEAEDYIREELPEGHYQVIEIIKTS